MCDILSLQLYEFEIPEAFSLNTPFGQVQASDVDIGTNAELYYHMLGGSKLYSAIYCCLIGSIYL